MDALVGFEIHGLRNPLDPTDARPVLFTNLPRGVTLPAEFSGYLMLSWLPEEEPVSGASWSADPRTPLGSGGTPVVHLLDDEEGHLAALLLPDPLGESWDLESVSVADDVVHLPVRGPTAPVSGEVVYLEGEALHLTAVSAVAMGVISSWLTYTLTVTRGACGSFARRHDVDPATYGLYGDGQRKKLAVTRRPAWEAARYDATLHDFTVDARGVISLADSQHYFIEEAAWPVSGKPWVLELRLHDVADVVGRHELKAAAPSIPLSHKLQVTALDGGKTKINGQEVYRYRAVKARAAMTGLEFELTFRERVRKLDSDVVDEDLVTDAQARILQDPNLQRLLGTDASGTWAYWVNQISYATVPGPSLEAGKPYVRVELFLADQASDATIADEEVVTYTVDGAATSGAHGYKDGWTNGTWIPLLPGEQAPVLRPMLALEATPMRAARVLLASDMGDAADDDDVLASHLGVGLRPSYLSRGAVPSDPLSVDPGTTDLLELDTLLGWTDFVFVFDLSAGAKLGDLLTDLCDLHLLLFGALADGRITFRKWARPPDDDIPTLRPLAPCPGARRLDAVRSFTLQNGLRLLDLSPTFERAIDLHFVSQLPLQKSDTSRVIRIYSNSDAKTIWESGPVLDLERAIFSQLGGAPLVYPVEVALTDGPYLPGAQVNWSDPTVLTPQGRGISGRFFVVGADPDRARGVRTLRLMQDRYNDVPSTEGDLAPTLPVGSVQPGPTTNSVKVTVSSLGDIAVNANTSHNGIFKAVQEAGGLIHVTRPGVQNPLGPLEQEGWLEAHATITDIQPDGAESLITLEVDDAWLADGRATLTDLFKAGETVISLPGRSPATSNVQGTLIEPVEEQHAAVGGFLHVASVKSAINKNLSKIST